ncbi:hypothetical protein KPL71_024433 [Citrus sinensis]|uniref:Uncharacterized protein n=1 Tax=Citrus sinensis TaxID=2711 RepID=A0ACB8IRA8_CITSI|nr:hypothetical protein KPL71_024433 [Citrus sinensis]
MGFSSYSQQAFSLLVLFITSVKGIDATNRVFNVKDFGAAADGIKDDNKAFGTGWREACNWDGIESTVLARTGLSKLPDKQSWITFQYLRHFTLSGEGTFHGQGETAWPLNQCHKNSDCQLPTSIRFNFLNDSTITAIKSVDSKYFHINILGCYNLKINDLKITAHADSPNTDGIHIGRSNGIEISHSVIATGDDCVSLGQGSKNILVSDVFFGPGHGISVGSLGKDTKDEEVVGLTACNIQEYSGLLSSMHNASKQTSASLPLSYIFQLMITRPAVNILQVPSQVKISNVRFNNIRGTSATKVATVAKAVNLNWIQFYLSSCQVQIIASSLKYCTELQEPRLAHNDKKGNTVAKYDKLAKKVKNLLPNLHIFNVRPIDKNTKNEKDDAVDKVNDSSKC